MTIYRGVDINDELTPAPWGAREAAVIRSILDTVVGDSLQQTSATTGHYHNKVYATSGGVVALSATSAGNIGIGTAAATNKLQVAGNIAIDGAFTFKSMNSNNIQFESDSGAVDFYSWTPSFLRVYNPADATYPPISLASTTNGVSWVSTDLANGALGGNFGVGTNNPQAKFHVSGTAIFSGVVSGVTPTMSNHLVTKGYVDNLSGLSAAALSNLGLGTSGYVSKYITSSTFGNSSIFNGGVNVGIGTITPSANFHVSGSVVFNNAVSGVSPTLKNHLATKAYVDSLSGSSSSLSGTSNYISKFTSTSGIGNSQIFDNGTSVSIGSSNAVEKLTISGGNLGIAGGYAIKSLGGNNLVFTSDTGAVDFFGSVPSYLRIYNSTNTVYPPVSLASVQYGTSWVATDLANGTQLGGFGVGTNNPVAKLHVYGTTILDSNAGLGTYLTLATGGNSRFRVYSTSGNTSIQTISADDIVFGTSGIERGRITSGGLFGINTASPKTNLHVASGSYGGTGPITNTVITVESNVDTEISLLSPSANACEINFGDPQDANAGKISYNHGSTQMQFVTEGSAILTLKSSGASFTTVVSGVTPTLSNHITTKSYVDSQASSAAHNHGTGTSGYIPKFITSSTFGNSPIYISGNGVGIGTNSVFSTLVLTDNDYGIPALGQHGKGLELLVSNVRGMLIGNSVSGNGYIQQQRVDGATETYSINLQPNGGSIGINTVSNFLLAPLHVSGNGYFTGKISASTPTLNNELATKEYVDIRASSAGHNHGFGTSGYVTKFMSSGGNLSASSIFNGGINVGIGTITPSASFQVAGSVCFNSVVSGVFPTLNNHLTTKKYVDGISATSANHNHGIGTSGFIPMYKSTSAFGNSIIYQGVTGYVGVGTNNPQQMLHLSGASPSIQFSTNVDSAYSGDGYIGLDLFGGYFQANTQFRIITNSIDNRMVITSAGYVGVNAAASPLGILHVNKNINGNPSVGIRTSVGNRSAISGSWTEDLSDPIVTLMGKGTLTSSGIFEVLPRYVGGEDKAYSGLLYIHSSLKTSALEAHGLIHLYSYTSGGSNYQGMEEIGLTSNLEYSDLPGNLCLLLQENPSVGNSSSLRLKNNFGGTSTIIYKFDGTVI